MHPSTKKKLLICLHQTIVVYYKIFNIIATLVLLKINLQQNMDNYEQLKHFFPVEPRSIYIFLVSSLPNSIISSSQGK